MKTAHYTVHECNHHLEESACMQSSEVPTYCMYLHRGDILYEPVQPHVPHIGPGTGVVEEEGEFCSASCWRRDQPLRGWLLHSESSLHKEHPVGTPVQPIVDIETAA